MFQVSPVEAERVAAASVLLTREELAARLKVSVRTVDRMIAAEEIPVRRVRGKAVRFLRADVERYLAAETRNAERGARNFSTTNHTK